jgi:hypothetical protein
VIQPGVYESAKILIFLTCCEEDEKQRLGPCWWKSGPKVDADTTASESFSPFAYCYEATSTNSIQGKEIRKYLTDQEMK